MCGEPGGKAEVFVNRNLPRTVLGVDVEHAPGCTMQVKTETWKRSDGNVQEESLKAQRDRG